MHAKVFLETTKPCGAVDGNVYQLRTCEHSLQNVLRSIISIHLVVMIIITEAESG